MTTHSLEPLRPWKAEQLGGGYAVSQLCERLAIESANTVIAVSEQMRRDVIACYPAVDGDRVTVVYNGIDADEYRPDHGTAAPARLGIDPDRPSVVFVGRITRQKGIVHLLDAAVSIDPTAQIVLLAGSPDTPEIAEEVRGRYQALQASRGGVVWVEEMVPRAELVQVLSGAAVFVCPSVYEPFGLVNLEAMACEVPVVASAVGGIPEVVVDGETGWLVPCEVPDGGGAGVDADAARRFAAGLADRVNDILGDPDLGRRMGRAGRRRVVERFSWEAVARRTADVYSRLVAATGA
jgi:starch synthase